MKNEIVDEAIVYVSACLGSSSCKNRAVEYIAAKYFLTKKEAKEAVAMAYLEWASAYE